MKRILHTVAAGVVFFIALVCLSTGGYSAAASGPTDRSGRAAPNARPATASSVTRSARQDFDAARFGAAAGKLEDLLRRNLPAGDRAEAYVLLCEARLRQGEFAAAESLAASAKTAGRISDEAALQRLSFLKAEVLYFSGDAQRASDEYIAFLEDNPDGPFVNDAVERLLLIDENGSPSAEPLAEYARAELALLSGAPDSALAVLDRILSDPSSPPIADDALAKKADLLRGLGKFSEAVTQYRLVEAGFPQSRLVPVCKLRIAEIYSTNLGQKEKAVAECEEIARGFPGTSYAVDARALLNALAGQAKDRK